MARELHLHIDIQENFAGGHCFGDVGAYERIVGQMEVLLDPSASSYKNVVDLEHARRDERGRVRYETDFFLLKPMDMARGNSRLLYDVVNRGDKRALQFFNDAAANNDPASVADAGNGFLMRQGYTILWSGWQADLLPGDGRTTLVVPIALDGRRDITGIVREEIIVDEEGVVSMPLSGKSVTRSHPTASLDTSAATLTRRQCQIDEREPIANGHWQFAKLSDDGHVVPSVTDLYVNDGFLPGWIYEVIYTAKEPQVLGLGFAAVRDLVDLLRHDRVDARGTENPLADAEGRLVIEKAYAWGRSQSGRFLREFVYRGWNEGRGEVPVFDAVWPHVTGAGRLALNLRFGHPDRYPRQHEQHLYPSDQFPFTYIPSVDPHSGETNSLLCRPKTDPLIFHTQTSSEYWQRRGSLVHTDADGMDIDDHPKVRMYHFSSSQHHAAPGIPPQSGAYQNSSNPLNTSPLLRALLVRLDAWATAGETPPLSCVPRCRDDTLVTVDKVHERFPVIGDIQPPGAPNRLFPQNYGPRYEDGIVTVEPPRTDRKHEYDVRVPAIDSDGNEVAGIRTPDVSVPRATYTGWNLRTNLVGPKAMYSIVGSYLPFAETKDERKAVGDERPSLAERYPVKGDYVRRVKDAAKQLEREGLLLKEDVVGYVKAAKRVI